MGIGSVFLDYYRDWHRSGWWRPADGILDVGAQQLQCADRPEAINGLLTDLGGPPLAPVDLARLADGGLAGELFERAGVRYASIDYKPYRFGLQLDLNRDRLPAAHRGGYGLVTNHGTSEHILNQWNVFETVHEATRAGGLMLHAVPSVGEFEHGVLNYNAKFFWALGDANGYERLMMAVGTAGEAPVAMPASFDSTIRFEPPGRRPQASNSWIVVLYRKSADRPFAGLVDPAFA